MSAAPSRLRRVVSFTGVLSVLARFLAQCLGSPPAFATHIRGASLTWAAGSNPGDVVFSITWSERADYPNTAGSGIYPAVGSTCDNVPGHHI